MSLQTPSPPEGHGGPAPANTQSGTPAAGGRRMSTGVKLVLMGVAGAALLYSCAPSIGSGLGAMPYLWFFSNPFYRGQTAAPPPTTQLTPGTTTTTRPGGTTTSPSGTVTPSTSQRGGFGSTGSTHGSSGSS
ncbi:MAG TPA: hypothetical protein VEC14_14045 [Reyranellaceae bacterium]|nr:hypothetical protein [Reyranellaceae bacterium]